MPTTYCAHSINKIKNSHSVIVFLISLFSMHTTRKCISKASPTEPQLFRLQICTVNVHKS